MTDELTCVSLLIKEFGSNFPDRLVCLLPAVFCSHRKKASVHLVDLKKTGVLFFFIEITKKLVRQVPRTISIVTDLVTQEQYLTMRYTIK